ncbi:hypothetical protein C8A01DRAFT_39941 [Parachaetomium inaequale]|uniref:AMP-dependent synthetase/ligase domain-containing protein n=1 Tax=Parachaetomium inaequale TaxID=2588326 RepID=A0AAN6PC13_9PEZI|nr:hypothetical protein C8A01DRAFT_39941 [Parachaetomium inaequale]
MASLSRKLLSPAALVDKLAAEVPHNVWVKTAASSGEGPVVWQDITWIKLRKAVDSMASWMENELGAGDGDEPVAYFGVSDIRASIVIMAALKAGYKSFLISPKNTQESAMALVKAARYEHGCTKLIFTAELRARADEATEAVSLQKISRVPELDQLLATPDEVAYESRGNDHMRDDETVLILHSSGTTGVPKLVYMKAGVLRVATESTSMPAPDGRRNTHNEVYSTKLLLTAIPFLNAYGATHLVRSLYFQAPVALTPTPAPLLDAIANLQPTAAACTPNILEAICDLPGGLEALSKLDHVIYGGYPLTKACGDKIARVTRLVNSVGSTETFNLPTLLPAPDSDPADWEYLEWNPHAGIVMEPALGDDDGQGMAELVIHRQAGNEYQSVFHNFPDLSEWRTNDLYERHPSKAGLWKCLGRMNDLIVLSSGEKMIPVMFERAVARHPWVGGVLVVGAGHVRAGLIIEPHPERAQLGVERFVDEVWPCVEEANGQCPAHVRVERSMICLATPGKPFKRVPKGLVMRKAMYGLYEEEIKRMYDGAM